MTIAREFPGLTTRYDLNFATPRLHPGGVHLFRHSRPSAFPDPTSDHFARHCLNPRSSSSRSRFRPMKIIRLLRASSSFHLGNAPSALLVISIIMCTPWKTYFSSEPSMESMPFERKISTPFSRSKLPIQALSFSRFRGSAIVNPTLVTDASCSCVPFTSKKASSISTTVAKSNALMPSTSSMSTAACVVSMIRARALIFLIFEIKACFVSSSVTRSILFSTMRSAKATCSTLSFSTPSGFISSRCVERCTASQIVTIASRYSCSFSSSSTKKVCATGAGSAKPVVSMMMWSNDSLRRISFPRMRTKSWRTVQQIHPLFISKISSFVVITRPSSIPTSPNSFSMIAILLPCFAVKM
mmetsp:Transcript_4971/g.16581  ORF Transcript_4971/g.16581 Transcript_4971/m.16581 type:complete len:356 (-) Transcript_4971:104-1171(-)